MSSILKFKEVKEVFFSKPALTCNKSTNLRDALELINNKDAGSIVITDDDNKAIGIFTERDFMKKAGSFSHPFDLPISEFMTPNPKSVPESFRLDVAVGIMRLGKFRHLVVTSDTDNTVVGVVSMRDFFNFFCDFITNEMNNQ